MLNFETPNNKSKVSADWESYVNELNKSKRENDLKACDSTYWVDSIAMSEAIVDSLNNAELDLNNAEKELERRRDELSKSEGERDVRTILSLCNLLVAQMFGYDQTLFQESLQLAIQADEKCQEKQDKVQEAERDYSNKLLKYNEKLVLSNKVKLQHKQRLQSRNKPIAALAA